MEPLPWIDNVDDMAALVIAIVGGAVGMVVTGLAGWVGWWYWGTAIGSAAPTFVYQLGGVRLSERDVKAASESRVAKAKMGIKLLLKAAGDTAPLAGLGWLAVTVGWALLGVGLLLLFGVELW